MKNARRLSAGLIVVAMAGLLGGCATSKGARFYLLTPVEASGEDAAQQSTTVAVGPIDFPKYIERPQIVTRGDGPRIALAEFDRWAEPLEQSFARVVTENLATLLSTDRVIESPWRGSEPPDYRVAMIIDRFDGSLGGDVWLTARWQVMGPGNDELIPLSRSHISVASGGGGYEGLTVAMSNAVAELCGDIADAIAEHRG